MVKYLLEKKNKGRKGPESYHVSFLANLARDESFSLFGVAQRDAACSTYTRLLKRLALRRLWEKGYPTRDEKRDGAKGRTIFYEFSQGTPWQKNKK